MSFTFQIQTTSNNQTFGFIADAGTLYIDWGDTQTTTEVTPTTGLRSHEYTTAGTYDISLDGTATRIAFYGTGATPTLLKDILTKMSDGLTGITSAFEMFRGCTKITTFTEPAFFDAVSGNVTTLASMFKGATNFNGDISNWDTSSVKSIASMFHTATAFNQDISSWDTSEVTTMFALFFNAGNFNKPLNSWNTSKVTNLQYAFYGATSFNQPIGDWDTSSIITGFIFMFQGATSFNQPLNSWNTSKATNMAGMFYGATSFDQDLSNWNVSLITNLNTFLSNVTLSTKNYNKLLISWANKSLKNNVPATFGNSKYDEGLPLDSKNSIVSTYTWTIADGGSTGNPYVPEETSPRIILGKGQRILLKKGGILKLKSI